MQRRFNEAHDSHANGAGEPVQATSLARQELIERREKRTSSLLDIKAGEERKNCKCSGRTFRRKGTVMK